MRNGDDWAMLREARSRTVPAGRKMAQGSDATSAMDCVRMLCWVARSSPHVFRRTDNTPRAQIPKERSRQESVLLNRNDPTPHGHPPDLLYSLARQSRPSSGIPCEPFARVRGSHSTASLSLRESTESPLPHHAAQRAIPQRRCQGIFCFFSGPDAALPGRCATRRSESSLR